MAAVLLALAGCSSRWYAVGQQPSKQCDAFFAGLQFPLCISSVTVRAFSDGELAAIINGVGEARNLPLPPAHDSTRLRIPFDSRADRLRGCTSIQESSFGGGSRPWSGVSALPTTIAADASCAVAYQLSDGTGEWHVRSGARRGTLSIEAASRTASRADIQAKAEALAAFYGSVFARAGK